MAGLFFARCKKYSSLLLLCFSLGRVTAQFNVTVLLKTYPNNHLSDTIFIAGNFNDWNPRDSNFQFVKKNDVFSVNIRNAPAGIYEFKMTRGAWSMGETNSDGTPLGNRKLQLASDTTIEVSVAGWSGDAVSTPKKPTASAHVSVLDTAFDMPALNRKRKVWLYLPEGYSTSKKRYPVLYMHDGQNLFDEGTAPFGEWGVDEWMDSLVSSGKPPCIVVGIENGERRMNEYNPFDSERFGAGEGRQYTDFIVKVLKPYIDEQYRTLPAKENTLIAGSSMGGLISYYAMLQYPQVFGKAGIFSPAFWTCPEIGTYTDSAAKGNNGKFFFYAGSEEGEKYVKDMERIQEKLGKTSSAMLYSVVDSTGKHNEDAWKKWFGEFYRWIIAQGFNLVIKTGD